MMHVYLPGFSPINKNEAQSIVDTTKQKGEEAYLHQWLHWQDENVEFDLDTELEIILSELKGVEEFGIISKSIGTVTAVNLLERLEIMPKYLVLLGIPLQVATKYKELYKALNSKLPKIYSIQNENDKYGSREDVNKFLTGVSFEEYSVESDTHAYEYPELIWEIIKKHI